MKLNKIFRSNYMLQLDRQMGWVCRHSNSSNHRSLSISKPLQPQKELMELHMPDMFLFLLFPLLMYVFLGKIFVEMTFFQTPFR